MSIKDEQFYLLVPLAKGKTTLSIIYTFDMLHTIPSSTCGIYCITCTVNGKRYVGSSKNVQRRMWMHRYNARSNNHSVPLLYDDMRLYGLGSFTVEILEQCSQRDLLDRENYWMEAFSTRVIGYNSNHKTDLRGKKQGENSFLIHLEVYNLFGYVMHKMPRHICGVYCITSLDTGKQYVGCSIDLKARLRQHKHDSTKNLETLPKLYNDMSIYGLERFKVELLEECLREDLFLKEQYWLDILGTEYNGYNQLKTNFRHTNETKQRFSLLRKGRVFSDEHRQKLSQAGMGKKFSDERIKALQRSGRKQSRLSEQDVKDIKRLMQQGVKPKEIMRIYNIGRGTYYDIKYGKSWRDVQADG